MTVEAYMDSAGGQVSVTISDSGRWKSDSAYSRRLSTRGRGLTLIHGLSGTVKIERGVSGTTVTMKHSVVNPTARSRP